MDHNLLFRWFAGLCIDDTAWIATVFSKNRDRLQTTDMLRKITAATLVYPKVKLLLPNEDFSVGDTLIKAWASMKSVQTHPSHRHQLEIRCYRNKGFLLQGLKTAVDSRRGRGRDTAFYV